MQKQKLAWFAGYITLAQKRNMFKKHISAALMVNFSAGTFKMFVNYHDK